MCAAHGNRRPICCSGKLAWVRASQPSAGVGWRSSVAATPVRLGQGQCRCERVVARGDFFHPSTRQSRGVVPEEADVAQALPSAAS